VDALLAVVGGLSFLRPGCNHIAVEVPTASGANTEHAEAANFSYSTDSAATILTYQAHIPSSPRTTPITKAMLRVTCPVRRPPPEQQPLAYRASRGGDSKIG
jgi:hypothetical protein